MELGLHCYHEVMPEERLRKKEEASLQRKKKNGAENIQKKKSLTLLGNESSS